MAAAIVPTRVANHGPARWQGAMTETPPPLLPPDGDVVIHAPDEGWSWRYYERAIQEFTRARNRAPRRITMHPDTLAALHPAARHAQSADHPPRLTVTEPPDPADGVDDATALKIVSEHGHDRDTIVLR